MELGACIYKMVVYLNNLIEMATWITLIQNPYNAFPTTTHNDILKVEFSHPLLIFETAPHVGLSSRTSIQTKISNHFENEIM